MTINKINGTNLKMEQMGMNQTTDSYSRNLQNQIANAQKQLQEISANKNMSLEEKMKKREEMQKKINDLNTQLRQYQMERRREKQQTKGSSMDDMLGGTKNAGSAKTGIKRSGISQAGMTAIISADSSKKQAKTQGSVAVNLNGTAKVLKSEIEADKKRGIDTQKQEEDLAEIEQKELKATASQMHTLSEANKTLEEEAKADGKAEKADGKAEKADGREGKEDSKTGQTDRREGKQNGRVGKSDSENVQTAGTKGNAAIEKTGTQPAESASVIAAATFKSVDVRL